MGVLPARHESIEGALKAGHDVALWPGGERDSLRSWTHRDTATLGGRTGFVRLAIRTGVPIVPIATIGGADAMPVLASGRRLAKLLRLRPAGAAEGVPDRASDAVGHLTGVVAGGAVPHQDPHRVATDDSLKARS